MVAMDVGLGQNRFESRLSPSWAGVAAVLAAPVKVDTRETPFEHRGRPPWGPHSCGVPPGPTPLPELGPKGQGEWEGSFQLRRS